MNARDEAMDWAVRYFGDPDEKPEDYAEFADALIAEGWRKMPSRAALTRHLANAEVILDTTDAQWEQPNVVEAERMADAILALMDGGSA